MLKNIKKYYNSIKTGKKIIDETEYNNKYIEKRLRELIKKGYTPQQARKILFLELGASAAVRESIEAATAEDCMAIGRLVGTEIGATVGSLGKSLSSVGIGATVGGTLGVYFGKRACQQIIKYASEKVVQMTAEKIIKNNLDTKNAELDLIYLTESIKNKQNINGFETLKAIKQTPSSKNDTILLKGQVSKNIYLTSDIENKKRSISKTKAFNKNNPLEEQMYEANKNDSYSEKERKLQALKNPQESKIKKVHEMIQNSNNINKSVKFDTKKDYSNYINKVIDSRKIFSKEDIQNMTNEEIKKNKKAIHYQEKTIGIPSEKQAKASGLVYVSGYTREDGTKVSSYYRTRPV